MGFLEVLEIFSEPQRSIQNGFFNCIIEKIIFLCVRFTWCTASCSGCSFRHHKTQPDCLPGTVILIQAERLCLSIQSALRSTIYIEFTATIFIISCLELCLCFTHLDWTVQVCCSACCSTHMLSVDFPSPRACRTPLPQRNSAGWWFYRLESHRKLFHLNYLNPNQ